MVSFVLESQRSNFREEGKCLEYIIEKKGLDFSPRNNHRSSKSTGIEKLEERIYQLHAIE